MENDIVVIGALAAGAYLLLGSPGLGGGAEGGGGKKATAITGITPGSEQGGSPDNTAPVIVSETPFQPSQYIMDLINLKYNPAPAPNPGSGSKKVIISTPNNPAPLADQWITARAASGAYGNSGTFVMPNKNILSPLSVQIPKPDPINNFTAKILAPAFPSAGAYSATALSIGTLTGNVVQGTSKKAASTTTTAGNNTYSSTPTGGTGMAAGSVSRTIGGVKYYR